MADRGFTSLTMQAATVLLLTSTISPRAPFDTLPRSSSSLRISDYKKSLISWLNCDLAGIRGIVYCDNSGFNLDKLKEAAAGLDPGIPIEFLSFVGSNPPPNMHYGYSELELVNYAVEHSDLIGDNSFILKCTGRLFFPRLRHLLHHCPEDYEAIVDCRGIHTHEAGLPIRVRTQLMLFKTEFYRRFIGSQLPCMASRRDSHIEEFIAFCLLKACCETEQIKVLFRFPVPCDPSGISANGQNYSGLKTRFRYWLMAQIRRYTPSLYA